MMPLPNISMRVCWREALPPRNPKEEEEEEEERV
jgi:hypothetical protein